jgi:hypothetical protein
VNGQCDLLSTSPPSTTGQALVAEAVVVADAYLIHARLWTEVPVPICPQIGRLEQALGMACQADQEHGARWRAAADQAST